MRQFSVKKRRVYYYYFVANDIYVKKIFIVIYNFYKPAIPLTDIINLIYLLMHTLTFKVYQAPALDT